jgi:hypothetical protein
MEFNVCFIIGERSLHNSLFLHYFDIFDNELLNNIKNI